MDKGGPIRAPDKVRSDDGRASDPRHVSGGERDIDTDDRAQSDRRCLVQALGPVQGVRNEQVPTRARHHREHVPRTVDLRVGPRFCHLAVREGTTSDPAGFSDGNALPALVGRLPTVTQPPGRIDKAVVSLMPPGQALAVGSNPTFANVPTVPLGDTCTIVVPVPCTFALLLPFWCYAGAIAGGWRPHHSCIEVSAQSLDASSYAGSSRRQRESGCSLLVTVALRRTLSGPLGTSPRSNTRRLQTSVVALGAAFSTCGNVPRQGMNWTI